MSNQPDLIVVEDDKTLGMLMDTILSSSGYNVHLATNGNDALEMCSTHNARMIFMDLKLPDMDGFTVAAILQNRHPEIKIVGFSAEMSPTVRRKCLAAGMVEAYSKQIDPETIEEIVRKHIRSN